MRGGGTASWEVLLGFLLQASPQARTGVSRETERPPPHPDALLRLLGWEAGPCDPRPVTEPFRPSAEKGSLVPESHWGSKAQEKNRAVSTLLDSPPSTRPRKGGGKCPPESKEERPPSPHHGLGGPFLRPAATLTRGLGGAESKTQASLAGTEGSPPQCRSANCTTQEVRPPCGHTRVSQPQGAGARHCG